MSDYVFETAEEALKSAVEVLRRRRLPKMTAMWREIESEAEWIEQVWEGRKNVSLPTDADERMHLALLVMEALGRAGDKAVALLSLWAMGDCATEGRLAAALAIQEKCRREGVRVRLAYRYSYEQLGTVLGCDRKTAWRRVQEALGALGEELGQKGLVAGLTVPDKLPDNFKKTIYYDEFKNIS